MEDSYFKSEKISLANKSSLLTAHAVPDCTSVRS